MNIYKVISCDDSFSVEFDSIDDADEYFEYLRNDGCDVTFETIPFRVV